MSIVLKATVKRPLKVDGEQLFPGDPFPFDPANDNHRLLWQSNGISLEQVSAGFDLDAIEKAVQIIDGIGPATAAKIREVIEHGPSS